MIGWLLATAGTAALGSVFPAVNIELYLIGVLSTNDLPWWALALAAALGQLVGKTLLYFAGRGGFTLGERLTRITRVDRIGRWAAWLENFHHRVQRRPWWGLGALFVSAVVGLPPYTVMCFATGAAGVPAVGFLGVSALGRSLHFLIVAASPSVIRELPALFG